MLAAAGEVVISEPSDRKQDGRRKGLGALFGGAVRRAEP